MMAYVSSRISWRRRRSQCIEGEPSFILFLVRLSSSGSWILTTEEITQSPKKLAEEFKKIGIDDSHSLVSDISETKCF